MAARILPEARTINMVLEKYRDQIGHRYCYSDPKSMIEIEEKDNYFLYSDKAWFESEGNSSNKPVCGVYVGMIEYGMEWFTGHKHNVEEIKCRAMGHEADVFKIWKEREEL